MNKVLVLGYFGYLTNQLDGQTVKTRDVYRLAKEQLNDCDVEYFDTQSLQKNKILVLKMFYKVMGCETLLYLPAHNNLKVFFPLIFISWRKSMFSRPVVTTKYSISVPIPSLSLLKFQHLAHLQITIAILEIRFQSCGG